MIIHLVLLLYALSLTRATHFRYGTLSWYRDDHDNDPYTITLVVEQAWRYDPTWSSDGMKTITNSDDLTISWSDGAHTSSTQEVIQVSTYDANGWATSWGNYTHTYANEIDPEIVITVTGCCRPLRSEDGNAGTPWKLQMGIDLEAPIWKSPRISGLTRPTFIAGTTQTYKLRPLIYGRPHIFRAANVSNDESGLIQSLPNNVIVGTDELIWSIPSSPLTDTRLYIMHVRMLDEEYPSVFTEMDWIVDVVNSSTDLPSPPERIATSGSVTYEDSNIYGTAEDTIEFTLVSRTNRSQTSVNIEHSFLPPGSTFSACAEGLTSPICSRTFKWTITLFWTIGAVLPDPPWLNAGWDLSFMTRDNYTNGSTPIQYRINFTPLRPTITSITPLANTGGGRPTIGGTYITITGINLGHNDTDSTVTGVYFNHTNECTDLETIEVGTEVTCMLPPGHGTVPISIVVSDGSISSPTSPFMFAYDSPTITSLVPPNGGTLGGYPITIQGVNYGTSDQRIIFQYTNETNNEIMIDTILTTMTCTNNIECIFIMPPVLGYENILIFDVGGLQVSHVFTFDVPTIDTVTQTPVHGIDIVITGTNMGRGECVILFTDGSTPYTLSGMATDHSTLSTLWHYHNPFDSLRIKRGSSLSTIRFATSLVPTITSLSIIKPSTLGGSIITIYGTLLHEDTTFVTSFPTEYSSLANNCQYTNCTFIIPSAPTGIDTTLIPLIASNGYGESASSLTFDYAPPTILSARTASHSYPQYSASGGTILTIKGDSFGDIDSPLSITIGSYTCALLTHTHINATCRLPAGSGKQLIEISTPYQTSSSNSYIQYDLHLPYSSSSVCH